MNAYFAIYGFFITILLSKYLFIHNIIKSDLPLIELNKTTYSRPIRRRLEETIQNNPNIVRNL